MPSHAGHKYFRRVTWGQVGNEKIDGNRGPERNKIKTNSTEQITHAYPFPNGRPQGTPLLYTNGAAPFVYSRRGACPPPSYFTKTVARSRKHTPCLGIPPPRGPHMGGAHPTRRRTWRVCNCNTM